VGFGAFSMDYDASAGSDDMRSDQITIPSGLFEENCLARIFYKGGDGNLTLQAIDGAANVLGEQVLAVSTFYRQESASFICPSSGTIALRVLASADAAQIFIDNMHLGENFLVGRTSQSNEAGNARWAGAASCTWSGTSGAFAGFALDSDCNNPVVAGDAQVPPTKVPEIVFNDLGPGKYLVMAKGIFGNSASGTECRFRINSSVADAGGISASPVLVLDADAKNLDLFLVGRFDYQIGTGPVTFEIQHLKAGAGSCEIIAASADEPLEMTLYKFPSAKESSLRPEQVVWRVDASQGGGNPDMGPGATPVYSTLNNGFLDVVTNPGSIPVLQACATGEEATGTTCTLAENTGITFTVPTAGEALVCMSFTHHSTIGIGQTQNGFRLVETNNADHTVIQAGVSGTNDQTSDNASSGQYAYPHRLCSVFNFQSAGKKTIRFQFEQAVSGVVTTSLIFADRAAGVGDRDIHWEVYPLRSFIQAPLILNHVSTEAAGGVKLNAAAIINPAAACSIGTQTGFIQSVVLNGTGRCDLTWVAGVFSTAPVCTCTSVFGSTVKGLACHQPTATTTSGASFMVFDTAGVAVDSNMDIVCVSTK